MIVAILFVFPLIGITIDYFEDYGTEPLKKWFVSFFTLNGFNAYNF